MVNMRSRLLDVIVRFHAIERLPELKRCLFSLVCQHYTPISVVIVTQRFTAEQLEQTQAVVSQLAWAGRAVRMSVVNRVEATPSDARSAMLNDGLRCCQGRYLAFLDYDDVIYADAYSSLTRALENHRATIAFGSVVARICHAQQEATLTRQKVTIFGAEHGLMELLNDNHCPIHSFVIDRSTVATRDLWFDETLTRLEDYDFLLRLCAKYRSSFVLKKQPVGDYYIKDDGSNSIHDNGPKNTHRPGHQAWRYAREHVERTKRMTFLSSQVHCSLGLPDALLGRNLQQIARAQH